MDTARDDDLQTRSLRGERSSEARIEAAYVLVLDGNSSSIHPLPPAGEVVITLGDIVLVLNRPTPPWAERGSLDAAAFRRRLDEEIDRSLRYQRPLAVLALLSEGGTVDRARALFALRPLLRLMDAVAFAGERQVSFVLPEASAADRRASRPARRRGAGRPGPGSFAPGSPAAPTTAPTATRCSRPRAPRQPWPLRAASPTWPGPPRPSRSAASRSWSPIRRWRGSTRCWRSWPRAICPSSSAARPAPARSWRRASSTSARRGARGRSWR